MKKIYCYECGNSLDYETRRVPGADGAGKNEYVLSCKTCGEVKAEVVWRSLDGKEDGTRYILDNGDGEYGYTEGNLGYGITSDRREATEFPSCKAAQVARDRIHGVYGIGLTVTEVKPLSLVS